MLDNTETRFTNYPYVEFTAEYNFDNELAVAKQEAVWVFFSQPLWSCRFSSLETEQIS